MNKAKVHRKSLLINKSKLHYIFQAWTLSNTKKVGTASADFFTLSLFLLDKILIESKHNLLYSILIWHMLQHWINTQIVSHLSLDESMCLSVFVKVSHGNTENFRHRTDSCTVQHRRVT